jgi:hypothetical protein
MNHRDTETQREEFTTEDTMNTEKERAFKELMNTQTLIFIVSCSFFSAFSVVNSSLCLCVSVVRF